jgi:hypothetical protein
MLFKAPPHGRELFFYQPRFVAQLRSYEQLPSNAQIAENIFHKNALVFLKERNRN